MESKTKDKDNRGEAYSTRNKRRREILLQSHSVLPEGAMALIGSIAMEATYAEHMIEGVIWGLLNLDREKGFHITNKMMMGTRIQLLSNLAIDVLTGKKRIEFLEVIEKLRLAAEKRNTVIHSYWTSDYHDLITNVLGKDQVGEGIVAMKPSKSGPRQSKFSADRLEDAVFEMHEANFALKVFTQKNWPEIDSAILKREIDDEVAYYREVLGDPDK